MKKIFYVILVFYSSITLLNASDYLLRSSTSNIGNSIKTNSNFTIHHSINKQSIIGLSKTDDFFVRQGFIQPFFKSTSIIDNKTNLIINLYPNPTSGKITISFSNFINGKIEVFIYDQNGKLVLRDNKKDCNEITYFLENLHIGNYHIKIITNKHMYNSHFNKL